MALDISQWKIVCAWVKVGSEKMCLITKNKASIAAGYKEGRTCSNMSLWSTLDIFYLSFSMGFTLQYWFINPSYW